MPPVGFEPAVPASERPQTHALDRAATGTGTPLLGAAFYLQTLQPLPDDPMSKPHKKTPNRRRVRLVRRGWRVLGSGFISTAFQVSARPYGLLRRQCHMCGYIAQFIN